MADRFDGKREVRSITTNSTGPMPDTQPPVVVTDRVIYVRWSDDGRFIRKWDTKPFDGGEPMYSRSYLLSEERVETAAKAVSHEKLEWCEGETFGMNATRADVNAVARAALSAAMGGE